MGSSPTVDFWECSAARGAPLDAVAAGCQARPPDFQGTIVHEGDGLVVVRVRDADLPRAAPETVYLVDGRGLYQEVKRVEWRGLDRGDPNALVSMAAV
jgi:hypothetical protein